MLPAPASCSAPSSGRGLPRPHIICPRGCACHWGPSAKLPLRHENRPLGAHWLLLRDCPFHFRPTRGYPTFPTCGGQAGVLTASTTCAIRIRLRARVFASALPDGSLALRRCLMRAREFISTDDQSDLAAGCMPQAPSTSACFRSIQIREKHLNFR